MNQPTGTVKPHIIIADDEELLCETVADFLWRSGYAVSIVHDGSEVIPIIDREKVDLVLLDMVMPVMNGLETLALIKQRSPQTRVLMLSGYDQADNVEQAKQLGSDGFITKPFGIETLMRRIRSILTNDLPPSFHEPPIEG